MAADIKMEGVSPRRLWDTVKMIGFGGAGYYHENVVHVDVGPARSWDEKTSGVGTGISDDNKLIGIVTDYDVYRPGEKLLWRFIRMTAFPIQVNTEFVMERLAGGGQVMQESLFTPLFAIPAIGSCVRFEGIAQMASIRWKLPDTLPPGRYRVRAHFCNNPWRDMPRDVMTPEFKIVEP